MVLSRHVVEADAVNRAVIKSVAFNLHFFMSIFGLLGLWVIAASSEGKIGKCKYLKLCYES